MFMPISQSLACLGRRDSNNDVFCVTGARQSGCCSPEMRNDCLAFILAFSQFRMECPFKLQMTFFLYLGVFIWDSLQFIVT